MCNPLRHSLRAISGSTSIVLAVVLSSSSASYGASTASAPAASPAAQLSAETCLGLTRRDVSGDVGTSVQISSAKIDGDTCVVEGIANPQIHFRLILPTRNWNGKILEIGNAAMAGYVPRDFSVSGAANPVASGYAVIVTDGGHSANPLEAKWADQNLPALIDYSFRAVHIGALTGKALVKQAYGLPARLAYFAGCSNGGREALKLAQDFPADFDGIIAGAPSMRMANIYLNLYWMGKNIGAARQGGAFRPEALKLLHANAVKLCSKVSGLSHGNLVHPERCTVTIDHLACSADTSQTNCLTAQEVADAKAAYRGPERRDGSLVAPASALPGSELEWGVMAFPPMARYPLDVYRYIAFGAPPSPGWNGDQPDLETYPAAMMSTESLWSATNPDLRAFKARGGKLLSYMGWNDAVGGVHDTVDYYRTTRRTMGGPAQTSDFYRLFMVPGMGHCTGGSGAYQINYLSYLERWIEEGKPPASLRGKHPAAAGQEAFEEAIPPFK